MAVPPVGCAGPTTITGAHTILLDPADTGGYTVVFNACTVTGTLTIDSIAAGVVHVNAAVDIQNSTAATFAISTGVLLGAGSRIRIKGLTGITAATLSGSAQDGAELLFSFVTLVSIGASGGLVISGTYATQSRLLVDFCSLSTTSAAAVTVSNAIFTSGSRFNISHTVAVSTGAAALSWIGTSAASSTPLGTYPTIIALANTSLSGRGAFVMLSTAPGIQSGALLHVSGGCTFAVGAAAVDYFLSLVLRGGLVHHDASNRYAGGMAGRVLISLIVPDTGGNYFALQGAAAVADFRWERTAGCVSVNDTLLFADATLDAIHPKVGVASGLNITLRRIVIVSSTFLIDAPESLTDSSILVEDTTMNHLLLSMPAVRVAVELRRSNITTCQLQHTATSCTLLIAAVRAPTLTISQDRVLSPIFIEDAIIGTLTVLNVQTDGGLTAVRSLLDIAHLSSTWTRSPFIIEETAITSHIQLFETHTDTRVTLRRVVAGHLRLAGGCSLVRTALLLHHSAFSLASTFTETIRLENTWNAATLEVLNTSVASVGLLFSVYVLNAPLNGSQHRFVDSLLVCTTTTYPASGTEPLQGVLVYAAGFGAGGLLEVVGTHLRAQHQNTYLFYGEGSGSRLYYDGSNACAIPGAANRGRLHMKTLVAGSGHIVRINNSEVDAVNIALASCADCEVSVVNTTIGTTFTLDLAGQTRLAHRMLNTTVGGAVTMTCSGMLNGGSVLLHELQASSVAHAATAIHGTCYVVQRSRFPGVFALTAALVGVDALVEGTAIGGAATVSGAVSNATLRIVTSKINSLLLVGKHTNTSLAIESNDLTAGSAVALSLDTGASSNITWLIQHNNMTGAATGLVLSATTVVSNGAVAVVNNTMGPKDGLLMTSGGGIGPGSTLWMRENRIGSGPAYKTISIEMVGGRLDHDGSNAYGGGGHVFVYLTATDAGGNAFVLQGAVVGQLVWQRTNGLATSNETITVVASAVTSALNIMARTCIDCVFVVDQCLVAAPVFVHVAHTCSVALAPPLVRRAVCLVSSRFTSTISIQGSFSGRTSTLQLLNSTFMATVTVGAAFAAATASSADIVAADIANSTFQTSGTCLIFSGVFSATGAATAALQVRDTRITSASADGILLSASEFGSNSRLYLQNVFCSTPVGSGTQCLGILSVGAVTWLEVWNSTFLGGELLMDLTSGANTILIVGNRLPPLSSITGVNPNVPGGRVAACNQDSSTAGWPALAVGALGFSDLACTPAQTVTRCGPAASGQIASVTAAGTVPSCLTAIPTTLTTASSTDLFAPPLPVNTSLLTFPPTPPVCALAGPPPFVHPPTPSQTFSRSRSLAISASTTRFETRTGSGPATPTALSLRSTSGTATPTALSHSAPSLSQTPACTRSAAATPSAAPGPRTRSRTPPPHTVTTYVPSTTDAPTTSSPSTTEAATTPAVTSAESSTAPVATPTTSATTTLTNATTASILGTTTSNTSTTAATSPMTTTTPSTATATVPQPTTPCATTAMETTSAVLHINVESAGDNGLEHDRLAQGSILFPLPTGSISGSGANQSGSAAALTPVWHVTAGSGALAAWFAAAVAPHITCATHAALSQQAFVCRLPTGPLLAVNETDAAAATLEATVQTGPCPAAPLRLVLTLVRPMPSPAASTATIVIFTAGIVGTTAYTLVVEPWAVEPLVLAGILDGPCAPPAVQDTARVAIYALNPFAALEPLVAGGLLIALVVVVVATNIAAAAVACRRRQEPLQWAGIVGRALFPRVAFAVAIAALPGVAWAAAGGIRMGPVGGPVVGVLVCAAYVVAVPCVGAAVVIRLAPAHYVPRRVPPSEGLWRRVVWPSGRWTANGGSTEITAAMNVRGLTAGPRGGALLFVGSTLLATSVFAITVAPPLSASCAARHYVAAALFGIAAVIVAALRPHRIPLTTVLTTLILLLSSASTAAVGAVAGDATAPYAPAAGLATAAMVLSIARSVHAVVFAVVVKRTAAGKASADDDDPCMDAEMALAVPELGIQM